MQFIPSNREDIIRYYRGTFTKFKDYGDLLFHIKSVDSSRVMGDCENGDPFCIWLDEDTPYEVEYILPHKSFFQFGEHAVQLQRIPAKQYFRGLCANNVQMVYLAVGVLKTLDITFHTLKQFVTKQPFRGLAAAINHSTAHTVVLSPRMMYIRARKELCIDFTPIAKVNPGKLTVTVIHPIFMDEIKEMLHANKEENTFKVELYVPPLPKEKTKTADLLREMQGKPVKEM